MFFSLWIWFQYVHRIINKMTFFSTFFVIWWSFKHSQLRKLVAQQINWLWTFYQQICNNDKNDYFSFIRPDRSSNDYKNIIETKTRIFLLKYNFKQFYFDCTHNKSTFNLNKLRSNYSLFSLIYISLLLLFNSKFMNQKYKTKKKRNHLKTLLTFRSDNVSCNRAIWTVSCNW